MEEARERRITELLLGYWKIIKGNRQFPDERDVNPPDIEDIWENCFVVAIEGDKNNPQYHYNYFGSALEEAYGSELGPDDTPPLASPYVERLVTKYQEVSTSFMPVIEENAFVNAHGETIRYRQILLPLGPNDGVVTHILGAMRYKIFNESIE